MANDYLISKWKNWFGFFYHNKDGKVSCADMETARDKFTSMHNLEGEKKQRSKDDFTKWWAEYVMWGQQEITVDEFIGKQNAAFKADREEFAARMRKCQETINEFIGNTENGFVTEEDLLIILKAIGQEDEEKNKEFSKYFSQKENKIPVKEMTEMWIHYLTSEDSSVTDPCQKAVIDTGIIR